MYKFLFFVMLLKFHKLCFSFDQNLHEMELKNFSKQHAFMEHLFTHMWGQLHFHLACLLLRKTKREQGSWSETGRLCAPLLLVALHMVPLETRTGIHLENDAFKNQLNIWIKEAAYRCCQAGKRRSAKFVNIKYPLLL